MITRLNLDGEGKPSDVPEGEAVPRADATSLYSSIAGQIVVGRYLLHVGGSCGGVVEETSSGVSTHTRPRPTPILLPPGSTRGLLDREKELTAALSAVDAGLSIEVSGESGVGKTAFLHQLAHHSGAAAFVDGVAYIGARHQSSTDILQLVFEAFYESDQVCKPTIADIRRGLEEIQALILIDDVQLPQHEMELVLDVAPRSALALATRKRCLFGELRSVVLEGLPSREAVTLLERELGRSIDVAERSPAANLCTSLGGHPLRIRQAASVIRDHGISIDVLARDIAQENLIGELMASTDEKHRRALLALAATTGVPIPAQHISALGEVTDIDSALTVFARHGLVVRGQSRYRLVDGVQDQLRRVEDLKPWINRSITYFTAWAERYRRSPNTLLEESEALLRAQQDAVDAQRWGEALRLGRLLAPALVLAARWGAWAIALDCCLAAAKAMKDRAAEAWTLHEMGTRALCLGETGTARALLSQALKLRETMEDGDALAASRRNLSYVLAPIAVISRPPEPEPERFADVVDLDALPLRDHRPPPVLVRSTPSVRSVLLMTVACAILASLAYWADPSELFQAIQDGPNAPPLLQSGLATNTTDVETTPQLPRPTSRQPRVLRFTAFPDVIARGESLGLCYDVANGTRLRIDPDVGEVGGGRNDCVRAAPAETTTYVLTAQGEDGQSVRQTVLVRVGLGGGAPRTNVPDRASILIFTPRPGSIATGAPTALCYAVNGAAHARIEPGIGEVTPTNTLTCLRVAPSRTTTYELVAYGRDGYKAKQQLVIFVR
jgi:hypothetical protein